MCQEKTIITFGRHRGKAFQYVYENDIDYCKMLLEHPREKSRHGGNSDEFISFLNGKINIADKTNNDFKRVLTFNNNSQYSGKYRVFKHPFFGRREEPTSCDIIDNPTVVGFVKNLNLNHQLEIKNNIKSSQIPINIKIVHEKCRYEGTNGLMGYFLMAFVKKVVLNIKQEELPNLYGLKLNYFPILLNWKNIDEEEDLDVLKYIDERIVQEIKDYLNEYFINLQDCEKEIKCMIRLINLEKSSECDEDFQSLLDANFLNTDREKYIQTLKKYMFFYSNCLKNYNEGLENCVTIKKISNELLRLGQSWKKFFFYKGDIMNIVDEILVFAENKYSKKYGDFGKDIRDIKIDTDLLKDVRNYIQSIPNIEKCIHGPLTQMSDYMPNVIMKNETEVEEEFVSQNDQVLNLLLSGDRVIDLDEKLKIFEQVDGGFLFGTPDYCLGNQIIDICYSYSCKNDIKYFYKLLLYSSLLRKKYDRLVIYNAYRGEETSIDVSLDKEIMKNFIRKYRHPLSIKRYAHKLFLTLVVNGKENEEETDEIDEEIKTEINKISEPKLIKKE